jgi:hypothetical protein
MSMQISITSKTTRASAIAGPPKAEPRGAGLPAQLEAAAEPTPRRVRARPWRSLVVKAAMLALIFVIVPLILYTQFKAADDEKQQLLLRSVGDQGRVMAQALAPLVAASERPNLARFQRELARFADDLTNVKLLFKPRRSTAAAFSISRPGRSFPPHSSTPRARSCASKVSSPASPPPARASCRLRSAIRRPKATKRS